MEDKKVLTIYRVGVLSMIFCAYSNDLVGGNRDIKGCVTDKLINLYSIPMQSPNPDSHGF